MSEDLPCAQNFGHVSLVLGVEIDVKKPSTLGQDVQV